MPSKKLDRRAWLQHARAWKKSGLQCKEYAEREGLKAASLSWWAWKLRSEGKEVPGGRPERRGRTSRRSGEKTVQSRSSKRRPREQEALPMVEITALADISGEGGVELETAGVVIRVAVGFDEQHLSRVLAAVGARR